MLTSPPPSVRMQDSIPADMPINLAEALHLFTRASPALRRYVADVPAKTNALLFADRDVIRRASIVHAVETESAPGNPDAEPVTTRYNCMFSPIVRSVPGRATADAPAELAADRTVELDSICQEDDEHAWLAPIASNEVDDVINDSTDRFATADPQTSTVDPWSPPARRPGEPQLGICGKVDLSEAASGVNSIDSSSWQSRIYRKEASSVEAAFIRKSHTIYGGIIASHVFNMDGTARLATGRCLIEPKTGDTLVITRRDAETVSIVSERLSGSF
jgi:hypothetical protein